MVDYCNNYNPLGHFKMTEEEIKSLSNYLADNLEVEAEGDEVALIYCCIKEWEQDGISRADKAAPVERIEGALEKLLRQFSIQNLSSEMDEEALERADFQWAYDMFINKTRAYLALQGGSNEDTR